MPTPNTPYPSDVTDATTRLTDAVTTRTTCPHPTNIRCEHAIHLERTARRFVAALDRKSSLDAARCVECGTTGLTCRIDGTCCAECNHDLP